MIYIIYIFCFKFANEYSFIQIQEASAELDYSTCDLRVKFKQEQHFNKQLEYTFLKPSLTS